MLKGNPDAVTPLRNEGSPMKATVRVTPIIAESCVVAASFDLFPPDEMQCCLPLVNAHQLRVCFGFMDGGDFMT